MKLNQLRSVIEVYRHGNHISAAAEALYTSQPGISKQIQLIEQELGFEIFLRKRNRFVGLTDPGREFIVIAQRILSDVHSIRCLGEEFTAGTGGSLTIATTHTQARYVLPKVIPAFIKKYPMIRLGLRQGTPTQICELVESGEVDIAIGSPTARDFPKLIMLPCFELPRSVVAKIGHPILDVSKLTLKEIAKYPIITYAPAYSGRWMVMNAFKKAGVEPNVILGAVDADVIKTYVDLGLGIAILTTITFDPARDKGLRARDASQLFEPSTTFVVIRPNCYLRTFVLDFINSLAPKLTPDIVRNALKSKGNRQRQ